MQDIYTWLQCFGMYISVLAPLHPDHVPELMASGQPRLCWAGMGSLRLGLQKASGPNRVDPLVGHNPHNLYALLLRGRRGQ